MFTNSEGKQYKVIDAHQHMFGRFDGFHPSLRRVFERVERHLREPLRILGSDPRAGVALLDDAGVDAAWVLAEEGPPSGFGADSLALVEYCGQFPDRLVPIGCINPNTRPDIPDRVERLFAAGIKGIKLYASDHGFDPADGRLGPVYERLARERLPLMMHTGGISRYENAVLKWGRPKALEPVIDSFPQMPVILVHSGKGKDDTEREALDLVERYENVRLEISDLSPAAVRRVCTEARAPICLFGSDMPQFRPSQYKRMIDVVTTLPITEAAKRAILSENAEALTDPMISAR